MADSDNESGGQAHEKGGAREQDRFLPIANVSRIMKKALPANAKISKDAKETVQECVSEFISFVTGEASDKCQREKRKTINGDDLLWAMATLGFEGYVEPLKVYLQKFRETEGEKESGGSSSNSSSKETGNVANVGSNGGGYGGGMTMYGSSPSPSSYDPSYHHHHQMGGKGKFGSGGNSNPGGFGRQGRG